MATKQHNPIPFAALASTDALLAPNSTSDWLDRRAALEADERKARGMREVNEWLDKYYAVRRAGGLA